MDHYAVGRPIVRGDVPARRRLCFGIAGQPWHMVAQLGREAHARTLALDYRLAPEHPFPAALEDTLAGYRFLLAQGIAPQRIALWGESAGGGVGYDFAALCRRAVAGLRVAELAVDRSGAGRRDDDDERGDRSSDPPALS